MWYPNDDSYSQKCTFNYQVQVADDYLNEGYWEVVAGLYINFEQRVVWWILISGIACLGQIENNKFHQVPHGSRKQQQ